MEMPLSKLQEPTPPFTPRSDSNPTTFVQADTSTFKQVVQILTGSSETTTTTTTTTKPPQQQQQSPSSRNFNIPPKKQGFKLYERRNSTIKNNLMINTLMPNHANNNHAGFSPMKHDILSPSVLDFPSLTISPVTPSLNDEPLGKFSPSLGNSTLEEEEEKAIAEKGFYLLPSPRTITPRDSMPQLLPLFPVTSPRVSESSSP